MLRASHWPPEELRLRTSQLDAFPLRRSLRVEDVPSKTHMPGARRQKLRAQHHSSTLDGCPSPAEDRPRAVVPTQQVHQGCRSRSPVVNTQRPV